MNREGPRSLEEPWRKSKPETKKSLLWCSYTYQNVCSVPDIIITNSRQNVLFNSSWTCLLHQPLSREPLHISQSSWVSSLLAQGTAALEHSGAFCKMHSHSKPGRPLGGLISHGKPSWLIIFLKPFSSPRVPAAAEEFWYYLWSPLHILLGTSLLGFSP